MDLTRRVFLKLLAASAALVAPLALARGEGKKVAIPLDKAPKLKEVGGAVVLRVKEQNILLARDSATTVRAINPECTHAKCQLTYNYPQKKFDCPCHSSSFDLDGRVQKGPATMNAKVYPATLSEERIIIEL